MMDQRNQTCDRYELKTCGNEEYDFHKKEKKKKEVVLNFILRKFQQQMKVSVIINLGNCEIIIICDPIIYMMIVYNPTT